MLQTPDYARTILSGSQISLDQADRRLVARLNRQKILTRRDPVRLAAVIDEMVIRREVGNRDIMSDQIDHLLELSELQNISLRIVPADANYHPGLAGPFMLYEFEDLAPIVYLEHHHASAFLHDKEGVAWYRKLAKLVIGKALSEDATREMLREVAR